MTHREFFELFIQHIVDITGAINESSVEFDKTGDVYIIGAYSNTPPYDPEKEKVGTTTLNMKTGVKQISITMEFILK